MRARVHSPVRVARLGPIETVVDRRPDGVVYLRSPAALGAYAPALTERLDHWARVAPERTFLAERDEHGEWRRLTYGEARARARRVAHAIIDRGLSAERPLAILSGNGIAHGLLALGAMYAGVPYAPIAPAYSLVARQYETLVYLFETLRPGLVFAAEGAAYERALASTLPAGVELVTVTPSAALAATPFAALESAEPTRAVDEAHARVGPDTIAKILFTSGSTGRPKGVITTQRMLCANQEMLRSVQRFLAEEPPVLCDWLPWNHTFGGSHNFGIVLYNGGTLYIDEGKPTPAGIGATVRNLREIASTAYYNVPRGYEMLVPYLRDDAALRERFFSRVEILFYAAAGLGQRFWDELQALAVESCGERIRMVTGLGATETAPFAMCVTSEEARAGMVGLPVAGVELKLAPVGQKLEARLKGPNVTPGFWRDEALTRQAFDEEGYYRLGDALRWVDPDDASKGFLFDGRLNEDFKLSTGTWVSVGPLRARTLGHLGPLAQDVVFTGHDRDCVGALLFPGAAAAGLSGDALRGAVRDALGALSREATGSSTRVARALVLDSPPSIDAGEITDKGTINQKAVLRNRAALVEELHDSVPSARVIVVPEEMS